MKQDIQTPPSRKNFLLLAVAAFFSAAGLRFLAGPKKKQQATITMLTQDGRLVEIDQNMVAPRGKKITDNELQRWIKKSSKN